MKLANFSNERHFAKNKLAAKYILSASDCDGYRMSYILSLAATHEKEIWDNLILGYTDAIGSEPLRNALLPFYQTIGLDEIVVSSADEATFAFMNVFLNSGDHFVCMSPIYQSLYQIAKDLGCNVSYWKPEINNEKWYYNPNDLKKLISSKTKLIVINFPHNPTGFCPNLEDYKAIIDIARKNGITIFSDEMYRFLHQNKEENLPSACDLYEEAISLWGTSKTFGLAGLRLGWLTSKNTTLLKRIVSFKNYLSFCNNAPCEILTTIALKNFDTLVVPNLEKIKSNIALFETFHNKHANVFSFIKPNCGTTAFIKLNIKETAMDFSEKLVNETGILLMPSETFDYGTSHVRIGFGRENMKFVLDILDNYLSK